MRHGRASAAVSFAIDAGLLYAAWTGSYALRFLVLEVPAPLGVPPFAAYRDIGAIVVAVGLLVLHSLGLYGRVAVAPLSREVFRLGQGCVITAALVGLVSYSVRGEIARSVVILFMGSSFLALSVARLAARAVLRQLRRRGRCLVPVLIVGTGEPAAVFARKLMRPADAGYVVRGFVATSPVSKDASLEGVPVLGSVADLPGLVESSAADVVYVVLSRAEYASANEALTRLSDSTAAVRLVPELAEAFALAASVQDERGTPVVLLTESPDKTGQIFLKRLVDVVGAAAGLVVLSPVLVAVAAWVKLDSPGPVFYVQERVGFNARRFHMLKFRTMRVGAEAESGPAWALRDDPRRTRAGRILRRLSFDELPQLFNVLAGQMSLVGPRPERPVFVERFRATVPGYMLRHHVKAGMTGWAQVNGLRGDTPIDRRIEYDLHYIRNWSLALDLRILLVTAVRIFRDRSAV